MTSHTVTVRNFCFLYVKNTESHRTSRGSGFLVIRSGLSYVTIGVDIPACLFGPAIQSCEVSTGAVCRLSPAGRVNGGRGRATGKPAWNLSDSTLDRSLA